MITSALLAAASLLPAAGPSDDTPTEPIDDTIVATFIASDDPLVTELCTSYRLVVTLVPALDLDPTLEPIFLEMVDAWLIIQVEQDSLRLTPEARDVLTDWLHRDCSGSPSWS